MRCKACDVNLNDSESTKKDFVNGGYLDLCDNCDDAGGADYIELELEEVVADGTITEDLV